MAQSLLRRADARGDYKEEKRAEKSRADELANHDLQVRGARSRGPSTSSTSPRRSRKDWRRTLVTRDGLARALARAERQVNREGQNRCSPRHRSSRPHCSLPYHSPPRQRKVAPAGHSPRQRACFILPILGITELRLAVRPFGG